MLVSGDMDAAADRVDLGAAQAAALSLHTLRCPSSPLCCSHLG